MVTKTIVCEEEDLETEIRQFVNLNKKELIPRGKLVELDCNSILEHSPRMFDLLLEKPDKVLSTIQQELASYLSQEIAIRLVDLNISCEIHHIRERNLNHLTSLIGRIKRITKIIPRTISIKFECPSCGTIIDIPQAKKQLKSPKMCGCGKREGFKNIGEQTIDIQEINLEEIQDNLDGKQPQQIRIYLEGDLTDQTLSARLQPGRKIQIIGVIRKLPAFMTQKDEELNLSEYMVYANNVISLEGEDEVTISEEDIQSIKDIAVNNPLDNLARSLVPEVYGNDMVKRAIVLQMVKGVAKERSDGSFSKEDIHILLSGDVGIAKSVTLRAVTGRMPKSRMVVGTKTSRVGLGAMAVKDELTNTWSLEVGALVLSNGSILCLDEIDKMYKEHLSDLLEPMSGGTVTINKAGISATLPARTSILASANPIHGNYDLSQPLAKQIDLPTPIINRFDLIFILIDRPNSDFDSNAVKHIFQSYKSKPIPDISPELFKKYVTYCKKLKPKLKDELEEMLANFYVNVRQSSSRQETKDKGIPVNLRNIEAIIRLAEAHAKLRLSEWVEKKDLDVAKEIFMFCIKQVGIDNETGLIDTSRMNSKIPASRRGKIETVLQLMHTLSEKFGALIPFEEINKEAVVSDIKNWEVFDFLEELKKGGRIYEPRKGYYQLL